MGDAYDKIMDSPIADMKNSALARGRLDHRRLLPRALRRGGRQMGASRHCRHGLGGQGRATSTTRARPASASPCSTATSPTITRGSRPMPITAIAVPWWPCCCSRCCPRPRARPGPGHGRDHRHRHRAIDARFDRSGRERAAAVGLRRHRRFRGDARHHRRRHARDGAAPRGDPDHGAQRDRSRPALRCRARHRRLHRRAADRRQLPDLPSSATAGRTATASPSSSRPGSAPAPTRPIGAHPARALRSLGAGGGRAEMRAPGRSPCRSSRPTSIAARSST